VHSAAGTSLQTQGINDAEQVELRRGELPEIIRRQQEANRESLHEHHHFGFHTPIEQPPYRKAGEEHQQHPQTKVLIVPEALQISYWGIL
jgi:hypothetical protein